MKAITRIKKATALQDRIDALLDPLSSQLAEILDDETAHITLQAGDGWCVCYGDDSKNAAISFIDIDAALKMSKPELLSYLESAGI